MIGDRGNDQALYFRMDEYSYRIAVHPDSKDDILYVGWPLAGAATLRQIADQIKSTGVTVQRRVVEFIEFTDPAGVACEIFYGPPIAGCGFVSPPSD